MFGVGHEGLESIVVVGVQAVLSVLNMVMLSTINLNQLPAAQRQTILQRFAAINAQPVWPHVLAIWERFWSFPLQVALAVIVLQVFRRHQMRWFWLAILFHALIDFVAAALPQAFGHGTGIVLLGEGFVCVCGLSGVCVSRRALPEERY